MSQIRKPLLFTAKGDTTWGNSIDWDKDQMKDCDRVGKQVGFWGWKQTRPVEGDYIEIAMKSGKHFLFKVTESKHESDPPDMFFAKGEFLGYKEDLKDLEYDLESEKKVSFFR